MSATAAHATGDFDLDGVPDATDNCLVVPKGPAELSNQIDTDADGFGNACDLVYDLDGDAAVTINDVRIFVVYRATGAPPGPGALSP